MRTRHTRSSVGRSSEKTRLQRTWQDTVEVNHDALLVRSGISNNSKTKHKEGRGT